MSLSRKILLAMTVVVIPVSLMAQGTVTGFVRDTDGIPIHGANVMVEETTLGTATDASGYFTIANVPAGEAVIAADVIGYEQGRQTITVPGVGSVAVNFVLEVRVLPGEEVIVVGYGTQQRREITGSVARVSDITFRDFPVLSFENAIQGLVSGVDVQEHTGEPGGAPNMRIRGTGSITAGNDPLYVIDGLPISKNLGLQGTLFRRRAAFKPPATNPLAALNPNDIESIEILKDASAAAIYGSRGSNGVVLITTKRAKAGAKPTVRFDAYTGIQHVAHVPDLMKAEELIEYTKEARNNNYLDLGDPSDPTSINYNPDYNPDNNDGREDVGFCTLPDKYITWTPDSGEVDWSDLIFREAPISNYNFSLSGGGEGFGYFLSGGYLDEQGIIEKSSFRRYSLSARLTGKASETIRFGLNLNMAFTEANRVPASAPYFGRPPGIVYSAIVTSPVIKVYNPDGTYNQLDGQAYLGGGTTDCSHPLAIIDAIDETLGHHRTFGNAYVDVELMKDLTFKSSLGIDLGNYQSWFYRANSLLYRTATKGDPYSQQSASSSVNWVWENTMNYRKSFNDVHNLTALVGYTAQREADEQNSVIATNFSDDQVKTISGGLVTSGSGIKEEWSLVSMLGRINYNYKYRYLFTAAIRSDRSSRFGVNNQTGYFPSISAAWRLSEEPFMQRVSALSEFKLRASYGITGNFLIPNYGAISLLAQNFYPFDDQPESAYFPSTLGDPELGWETTKQVDVGLDFGFFDGRVYGTIDVYDSRTEDLLMEVSVPSAFGYTEALTNIGKVQNMGMELSLTSRNFVGPFLWATDLNFSSYKNEVLALGPGDDPILVSGAAGVRHITRVGDPIGSYYGYVVEGIYQNEAEIAAAPEDELAPDAKPGDFKFKDVNGDGVIDTDDRTVTGSYHPDFTYGFTNRFSFKGFDLSVFIQGVQGRKILNLTARHMKNGEANFNAYAIQEERWRSEEDPGNGIVPRADRQTEPNGNNNRPSSYQVEDGSYLRLRNLTLGYTLPATLTEKVAQSVRIYISGRNLLTLTDYLGFNPEVSLQSQSMLTPGEDYGAYPLSAAWTFGLNITF